MKFLAILKTPPVNPEILVKTLSIVDKLQFCPVVRFLSHLVYMYKIDIVETCHQSVSHENQLTHFVTSVLQKEKARKFLKQRKIQN